MRHYSAIYWAFLKISLLNQFQYRAAMSIWMIGRILEPIIYLTVWSTVAQARGGHVGAYSPADFAAYYIVLMIVNQFTFSWIMHIYDFRIRQGELSNLLLKPIHPIHSDIAENIAYKLMTAVIIFPTAISLFFLFEPNLTFHIQTFATFLLALGHCVLHAIFYRMGPLPRRLLDHAQRSHQPDVFHTRPISFGAHRPH